MPNSLHAIPHFLAGSFAAQFGDHLWPWDHLGIICGRELFAVSGSFAALYRVGEVRRQTLFRGNFYSHFA